MSLDHKDHSCNTNHSIHSTDYVTGDKKSVAARLSHFIHKLFGGVPSVKIEFWDGSSLGTRDTKERIIVTSRRALRYLLWSPNELGLSRAYIMGDIRIEGDIFRLLAVLDSQIPKYIKISSRDVFKLFIVSSRLGIFGPPPKVPEEEFKPHKKGLHNLSSDKKAISHHYDVGNDFYRLILGESMTYSCARFIGDVYTLAQAQEAKHDLICAKLGLREQSGLKLLDIGCGWGSMAIHAAKRYNAYVLGITLSEEQASYARQRVREAGLEDRVEIRVQDYRTIKNEQFDAVSSVGMFEHVGAARSKEYFTQIRSLLLPGGRLCNHAISKPGGSKLGYKTFANRYVFPDGELQDVGNVVLVMEEAGFEVRDVESLREHYDQTLHCWVENLENNYDEVVRLVGEHRVRAWHLYMAASANGFRSNHMSIHQVLGVVPWSDGKSYMPPTRNSWG